MKTFNSKPTLLVADDDVAFGEIVQTVAEDMGFEVTCVSEGSEVIAYVERLRPTVIALDLRMPGSDGVEIIRELGSKKCKSGILLMSGMDQRTLSSVQTMGKENNLDMRSTLTKPVSLDAIETALTPYLKVKEEATPSQANKPPTPIFNYGLGILFEPELQINPLEKGNIQRVRVCTHWRMDDGMMISGVRLDNWSKDNGLAKGISRMVLAQSLDMVRTWSSKDFRPEIVIRIDDSLLSDLEIPDILANMADQYLVPRNLLGIELEESSLIGKRNTVSDVLSRLRIKGFRLSVNALGKGENLLPLMETLPIDQVTLDVSSLKSEPNYPNNMELEFLYSSLTSVTNHMGIQVCAKNVNSEDDMKFVQQCKFNSATGRHVALPSPARSILPLFNEGKFATPLKFAKIDS
ncbi:MAG: hypothetical protein COA96_04765 [SAR86 cluster bacterium]|uniref:EAL domain-containing protein n=1 Tax=SAR86 cluster bacterium TaxID=2030880 RepID=A0A2A5B4X6_9GAMM|nr:MAG: hypothetical protein COA96_04765 [SAR86 cluster bacterium]